MCYSYMYMDKVPSLNPLTQDGITPVYVASGQGQSSVVNILIRNGADINLANNVCVYYIPYVHCI